MKRGQTKEEVLKGYKFDLSEIYEVAFKKETKYHRLGEKDFVSLPIAIKFANEGKVDLTPEIKEAANKAGMAELIIKNVK